MDRCGVARIRDETVRSLAAFKVKDDISDELGWGVEDTRRV
jgi:hypothetical protein